MVFLGEIGIQRTTIQVYGALTTLLVSVIWLEAIIKAYRFRKKEG